MLHAAVPDENSQRAYCSKGYARSLGILALVCTIILVQYCMYSLDPGVHGDIASLTLAAVETNNLVNLQSEHASYSVETKSGSSGATIESYVLNDKNIFSLDTDEWMDIGEKQRLQKSVLPSKVCHHFQPRIGSNKYPNILKKTVFNEKNRFVFVMGLEGAGHHLFSGLLENCESCLCPPALDGFSLASDDNKKGFFGTKITRKILEKYVSSFQTGMRKLNSELAVNDSKRTYFINTICATWTVGELSYPNYAGKCRDWKFADVRILAEMFESVGIDFRVLVITRNAIDTLMSTVVHRHFEGWNPAALRYIKMLKINMAGRQLGRIDKKFVLCWNYDDFPSLPEGTDDFLNLNTGEYNISSAMKNVFHRSSSLNKTDLAMEKALAKDVHRNYVRLQNEIDVFRARYCP